MTARRQVAVGLVILVSGLALGLSLRSPVPATGQEWDWPGLDEDLDLLESLPVDGPEAWRERSDDLVEELAAVDGLPRTELERHLPSVGRLLAVAGLAAERAEPRQWPGHGVVDGQVVNVSWYRAARLARAHPDLGPLTGDPTAASAIDGYLRAMAAGELAVTDRSRRYPRKRATSLVHP